MKLLGKLLYSVVAIFILGICYYFLLRHVYYDPISKSFADMSLNEDFTKILFRFSVIDFNGHTKSLLSLTFITIFHFIVSFIVAVFLGIVIGVIVGTRKNIGRGSDYFINFFRVLPSIIFITVFKWQLKFSDDHVFFVIVIASIWPIIINTKSGVEKVNKTLREAMCVLNIPYNKKLFLFTLPEAAPNIWDGIKTSMGIAFLIAITCEYLSPTLSGLGAVLHYYDGEPGNVCFSLLIILWIGFLGVLINFLFDYIEKRMSWLKNQFSTEDE